MLTTIERRQRAIVILGLSLFAIAPGDETLAQALPGIVINDVTVEFEGSSGGRSVTLTVGLTGTAPHGDVTVFLSTSGGTATAGAACTLSNHATDYVSVTNVPIAISSAENSKQVQITVCGDIRDEPEETIVVALANANGAVIQDAQGQVTIRDDDEPAVVVIDEKTQLTFIEGAAGVTSSAVFTVLLGQTDYAVTVGFETVAGSATSGNLCAGGIDFVATTGTITFAAGSGGATGQTIAIPVCGDGVREGNETFWVRLTNAARATITRDLASATITDDEPLPSLSISELVLTDEPTSLLGSRNAEFIVSLAGPPTTQTVTVQYATAAGNASAGSACTVTQKGVIAGSLLPIHPDFATRTGTLTFAPGTVTQRILVPICSDNVPNEPIEMFTVTLSSATNATIARATGSGGIR